MTPKPPHPSTIKHIPMRHKAEIRSINGRWFRYEVFRWVGIFYPECSLSYHRTLRGAQRAAERWRAKNGREATVVESRR